jgi:Undecaprenyl-phosphate glucose phosphotransferase
MLKRHSQFFKSLMLLNDLVFLSLSWWLAYLFRFHSNVSLFAAEPYVFRHYVIAWALLLVIYAGVFLAFDLYRPRRISTHWRELADLFKSAGLAMLIFLGMIFLLHEIVLSRFVVLFFWAFSTALLNLSHLLVREGLRFLRRRGKNLRYAVVVGTPGQANRLVHRLDWYRHLGLSVVGVHVIGDEDRTEETLKAALKKNRDDLLAMIRSGKVDQVFVTFPLQETARLAEVQNWLGDEPVSLFYVPDLGEVARLHARVEEFDDLHIVTLQASPLDGWNTILKRSVDLLVGALAVIIFSPWMILIALAIRLTSPGPILYKQERMGLDGKRFQMLKFRTMVDGAESSSGPVWATRNDPRVTWLGHWLRRTSLDELPQLINVLWGEMSLVGPRPERPLLIEQFRKSIPKYMLRQKVKAGMTGWAQVNGWRGDTSLEKRIEHDIEYIESWSLGRDLKILALTFLRGFVHRNAG